MICKKCGFENPEEAKFCKKCGEKLETDVAVDETVKEATVVEDATVTTEEKVDDVTTEENVTQEATASVEEKANEEVAVASETAKDSPSVSTSTTKSNDNIAAKITALPKMVLIGIGAAVVALILLFVFVIGGEPTIDLNKYLETYTIGYDGYGTASYYIDWAKIQTDYGNKLQFTKETKDKYGALVDLTTPAGALETAVSVQFDKNEKLSNGDKIAYTWNVSPTVEQEVRVKLKYSDGTIDVKDLAEVGTFDAFADLDVTFTGMNNDGAINYNYKGSELSTYAFSASKSSGLSNGEKVTISLDESKFGSYATSLGKIPAESKKEYTVSGLTSYVTKLSEISEDSLKNMQAQAKDEFDAIVASDWDKSEEKLEGFEYLGNYLLTGKEGSWGDHNKLYLVYRVKVHNTFSGSDGKYDKVNTFYWWICYENLKIDSEGKINVNLTINSKPYNSFEIKSDVKDKYWTKSWYYNGYKSFDALYDNVVTSQLGSYNHEDNAKE